MEQTAQNGQNTMGWQMAGATPRTAPAGGWVFAPAEDAMPAPRARTSRPQVTLRPVAAKRPLPRLLPAALALTMVSSLIGGVAVARYSRNPAITNASAYPMNVAVTVQGGDSLWSIAKRYGSDDRYILDQVDEIASANSMSSDAALYPGQQIWVPAHNAEERAHITARRVVR